MKEIKHRIINEGISLYRYENFGINANTSNNNEKPHLIKKKYANFRTEINIVEYLINYQRIRKNFNN